jgi:hypothetical protein
MGVQMVKATRVVESRRRTRKEREKKRGKEGGGICGKRALRLWRLGGLFHLSRLCRQSRGLHRGREREILSSRTFWTFPLNLPRACDERRRNGVGLQYNRKRMRSFFPAWSGDL